MILSSSNLVSIIIPAYNEEKTIIQAIKKVLEVNLKIDKEIIVVNDCSQDNTLKKLEKIYGKTEKIKIISHTVNKGKGAAIQTGLRHAKGGIIGIQDADLEYNPEDYPKLIEPMLNRKVKVVYGSRFLRKYEHKKNQFFYGNKILSLITSILYLTKITDMETCYKFFRKEVIKNMKLKSRRFDIEPEITAKILKKGYKIKEVPIFYHPRSREEGKKIDFKDGIIAIFSLIKYRFLN